MNHPGAHRAIDPDREGPAFENPATLEALLQLAEQTGEDELGSVLSSLRTQGGDCVSVIRSALRTGDSKAIIEVSHSLIGSAGALGATALESLSRRICTGARQGELAIAAALLETLQRELDRALLELSRIHERGSVR